MWGDTTGGGVSEALHEEEAIEARVEVDSLTTAA